jgi:hypothetical protein
MPVIQYTEGVLHLPDMLHQAAAMSMSVPCQCHVNAMSVSPVQPELTHPPCPAHLN